MVLRIEHFGLVLEVRQGFVHVFAEQGLEIEAVCRIHFGERLVALILKLLAQAAAIFREVEGQPEIFRVGQGAGDANGGGQVRGVEVVGIVLKQPIAIMDQLAERFFLRLLAFLAGDVGLHAGYQVFVHAAEKQLRRRRLFAAWPAGERRIVGRDGVAGAKTFEHQAIAAADVDAFVQANVDQVFIVSSVASIWPSSFAASALSPTGRRYIQPSRI